MAGMKKEVQQKSFTHQQRRRNRKIQNKKTKKKKKNKCKKADLYVIRINNTGELRNSKPCKECVCAMKVAGIKRVFYSTSEGTIFMEKVQDMRSNHLSNMQKQIEDNNIYCWKF